MDSSQRCTEDVWKLANKLVDFGGKAFYPMMMKPVEGKNPVQKNAVYSQIFETGHDEQNFVLSEIKKLLSAKPDSTIGILLRHRNTFKKQLSGRRVGKFYQQCRV